MKRVRAWADGWGVGEELPLFASGLVSGLCLAVLASLLLLALSKLRDALFGNYLQRNMSQDDDRRIAKTFERIINNLKRVIDEDSSPLGILVASGAELKLVSTNGTLREMLNWGEEDDPTSVHEMLVSEEERAWHQEQVAHTIRTGQIPYSLKHPMRSVMMKSGGGHPPVRMTVTVGFLSAWGGAPGGNEHRGELMYALIANQKSAHQLVRRGSSPELRARKDVPKELTKLGYEEACKLEGYRYMVESMYGSNVAHKVASGSIPDPEVYDQATVLYLDVVGFTQKCQAQSSAQVASWMSTVHKVLEGVLLDHFVRKVEIRGDCYILVSGTNHVQGDSSSNQMTRMVAFAAQVGKQLMGLKHITPIRVGIATGPTTIAYIGTSKFAPTLCAFGETVWEAAEMEKSGEAGMIHMTEESAKLLCLELKQEDQEVPLEEITIKGKHCKAAWFDWQAGNFLTLESVPVTGIRAIFHTLGLKSSKSLRSVATSPTVSKRIPPEALTSPPFSPPRRASPQSSSRRLVPLELPRAVSQRPNLSPGARSRGHSALTSPSRGPQSPPRSPAIQIRNRGRTFTTNFDRDRKTTIDGAELHGHAPRTPPPLAAGGRIMGEAADDYFDDILMSFESDDEDA